MKSDIRLIFAFALTLFVSHLASADDTREADLVERIEGLHQTAVGVTRRYQPIPAIVFDRDSDFATRKIRVLIAGSASPTVQSAVDDAITWFYASPKAAARRAQFVVSAVPKLDPDRRGEPVIVQGVREATLLDFPPAGTYYGGATDPAKAYAWRWIGMHAPDVVVVVEPGDRNEWQLAAVPARADRTAAQWFERLAPRGERRLPADHLAARLNAVAACETGTIPAVVATVFAGDDETWFLEPLFQAFDGAGELAVSPARRELQARVARSPRDVATQLSRHYGHDLNQVAYIPALALIGRLRLGELTGDASHRADVLRIVGPYFRGEKPVTPRSGSEQAGHLLFCELAESSAGETRERFLELAKLAADLAFDAEGAPRPSMPAHNEMSDAVFMSGPILARVGRLADDSRYFDACVRHLRFMRPLVLRGDGLYRHSPLDEAAWGRGNGFPALGMAMVLSDFPAEHPDREELLGEFRRHMAALVRWQAPDGSWHQVIDKPGSYRELSCTCMIAFAMVRGVRRGWLDREEYQPVIQRAWRAIKTRAPGNGRLVDVCTGTGKQQDLQAYYDRPAILGPDPRGGAMVLMIATEIARWHDELAGGQE